MFCVRAEPCVGEKESVEAQRMGKAAGLGSTMLAFGRCAYALDEEVLWKAREGEKATGLLSTMKKKMKDLKAAELTCW